MKFTKFAHEIHDALADARVGPIAQCVFVALLRHGSKNGHCYPGFRRLKRITGIGSDHTLKNAIHILEENGFIRVERATGRANRYLLQTAAPTAAVSDTEPPHLLQHTTAEGAVPVPHLLQHKKNHLTRTRNKTSKQHQDAGVSVFEKFWKEVHLRKGKAAAKKAFSKAVKQKSKDDSMSIAEAENFIVERMRLFAASPESRPTDHTPIHPTTWLNQGRYDDDIQTWNGRGSNPNSTTEKHKPTPLRRL